MAVEIRTMTAGDIPAAVELWSATEGVELDCGDSPAEIAAFLDRNPGLSVVAMNAGELVGAVQCGHDGRRGWVYHLAVARSHRGRGIAKAMVDRCVAGLQAAGITRALLFFAEDNDAAHRFWVHQGWAEMPSARPMALDL
jgi:ribosomal protein S18 acetylase RimI-like enzyme